MELKYGTKVKLITKEELLNMGYEEVEREDIIEGSLYNEELDFAITPDMQDLFGTVVVVSTMIRNDLFYVKNSRHMSMFGDCSYTYRTDFIDEIIGMTSDGARLDGFEEGSDILLKTKEQLMKDGFEITNEYLPFRNALTKSDVDYLITEDMQKVLGTKVKVEEVSLDNGKFNIVELDDFSFPFCVISEVI